MKTRIDIDTNTFIRFWLVLIGFALALFAIYSARTALIMLAIAAFLALALNIPVNFIAKYLPSRSRVLATAVAYLAVVAALLAFIFLAVPPIVQQTGKFIDTVPEISSKAFDQWKGLDALVERYHLQAQLDKIVGSIQDSASDFAANAGSNIIKGAGSVISFVTSMLFVLVLTFLMLVEGPIWLDRVWGLYSNPVLMKRHRKIAYQIYRVVTGYVTGQLLVAGIGGILSGVAVFILSLFFALPGNLALSTVAITFTLSLIPMFGATIAGVLVMLLLSFNSVTAAIIYIVYFFIYQQIENNFVSPVIQSKRLELSALAVLVAVTIGLYVFGLLGGLISIPIAGSIKVLIDDYLEHAKRERDAKQNVVAKLVRKTKA